MRITDYPEIMQKLSDMQNAILNQDIVTAELMQESIGQLSTVTVTISYIQKEAE